MNKFLLMIMIILLSFSSSCKKENNEELSNNAELKVGYLNMVSSLTHFVAKANGYYKEQNLTVTGLPINTSNMIAQELATGHIDVGIELSIIPLLKTLEQSPNTITIYSSSNISVENGFDAIVVTENSNVTSLKELTGKKVGGFPGTTAKNSFLQVFRENYPNIKEPNFHAIDPNLQIQALERGEIDALFAYEPVLSIGIVKRKFKKIFPSIYGTQFENNPIGVGAINTDWLKSNPEVAKRFFNSIDKAVDFIEKNPIKAKEILAKETNLELSIAQNMNTLPLSKSNKINLNNLDKYFIVLKEIGEINEIPVAKDICLHQD